MDDNRGSIVPHGKKGSHCACDNTIYVNNYSPLMSVLITLLRSLHVGTSWFQPVKARRSLSSGLSSNARARTGGLGSARGGLTLYLGRDERGADRRRWTPYPGVGQDTRGNWVSPGPVSEPRLRVEEHFKTAF